MQKHGLMATPDLKVLIVDVKDIDFKIEWMKYVQLGIQQSLNSDENYNKNQVGVGVNSDLKIYIF